MKPLFCFTLDTEPDNVWVPCPQNSFEHFSDLRAFHEGLVSRGCRPTYLTTSEVVEDQAARRVMETILESGCAEIGAHFHTWTRDWPFKVPELRAPCVQAMADRLGQDVEERMLDFTCRALRKHLGVEPVSHRGGRWSLNGESIRSLENCGVLVDSTVTPGIAWLNNTHPYLDGPDFRKSTRRPHYLRRGSLQPHDRGPVLEIPVGASFHPNRNMALSRSLPIRCLRKVSTLLGLPMGHLWLRPAVMTSSQLRRCLLDLMASQIEVWVVMVHSSEIGPNHSFSDQSEIQAFKNRCYQVVEDAIELGAVPTTMKEVWDHFDARRANEVCGANGRKSVSRDDPDLSARPHVDPD